MSSPKRPQCEPWIVASASVRALGPRFAPPGAERGYRATGDSTAPIRATRAEALVDACRARNGDRCPHHGRPTVDGPRILGLFEGYGGLTMGVQSVLGGELVAYAEIEPAMVSLLAQHHPSVPNLGDVSTVDWSQWAGRVDVMTGGFPCQDVSLAGLRRGLRDGTRSGLWSEFARGIDMVRPGLVVIENVRGLLSAQAGASEEWTDEEAGELESAPADLGAPEWRDRPVLRALGAVLGDLADLGYDARWCGLFASDAGAPHPRYRVFVVASPADANVDELAREWRERTWGAADTRDRGIDQRGSAAQDAYDAASDQRRLPASGQAEGGRPRANAGGRGGAPAPDASGRGRDGRAQAEGRRTVGRAAATGSCGAARSTADADDYGREERIPGGLAEEDAGAADSGGAAADAERDRRERRGRHGHVASSAGTSEGHREERERNGDAADDRCTPAREWGPFAPAVHRWEAILGRVAPAPTAQDWDRWEKARASLLKRRRASKKPIGMRGSLRAATTPPAHRLSPRFVEWMMGLPAGHITDPALGLTGSQQLKGLGNGVVPQQAALAVAALLAAETADEVAV